MIETARATPRLEAGGPVQGLRNDLLSLLPTPGDIGALAGAGSFLRRLAMNDPKAMADVSAAGAMAPKIAPQLAKAMVGYATEHPFATGGSLVGPKSASAAYGEHMPPAVANYLHLFTGGGKPRTRLGRQAERDLGEMLDIDIRHRDFMEGANKDMWIEWNERRPYKAASEITPGAERALVEHMRKTPQGREALKRMVEPGADYEYVDFDARARFPRAAREEILYSGDTSGEVSNRLVESAQTGLGKFFLDRPRRKIFDWYEFFPEAYLSPGNVYGPHIQELMRLRQERGRPEATIAAAKKIAAGLGKITNLRRKGVNPVPVGSGGESLSISSPWHTEDLPAALRWLAMEYGTPYPIEVQLPPPPPPFWLWPRYRGGKP